MAQDQTKKEALFNEVKGSLFEYLVARKLAEINGQELAFIRSLDQNYLTVLSQQDRMVRQFYPGMIPFLTEVAARTSDHLISFLGERPTLPRLMGKFVNSSMAGELDEADLILTTSLGPLPVSLKLNKRNAFVNTKSAGIRSFFSLYMDFLPTEHQKNFNQLVDMEFARMGAELHALHEMDYPGNFRSWVKRGLSELPGELSEEERAVLKSYYARLASEMYSILSIAFDLDRDRFARALAPLMGFGKPEILQVVCFHDFKQGHSCEVEIHPFSEVSSNLGKVKILPFNQTSSLEIEIGHWVLQIRVKPMNKFTTTAIKINCSVKVRK